MTNTFYLNQLKPLVGGTITGTVTDLEGEFFGLRVRTHKQERVLWILRDDEGNGPGSFNIEPA